MYYQYRFTLNGTGGIKSISEPEGWSDITINLERQKDYYCLLENFEAPFAFYGSDGIHDGGYAYVKHVRDIGPDYVITILIEISIDGGDTWGILFDGLVTDLVEQESKKKIQFGITRNDLWSRFWNRKDSDIDVKSTTTLDGTTVTACASQSITLPSQEIFQRYLGIHVTEVDYNIPQNTFGVIDFDSEPIKEIKTKYNYPRVGSDTQPAELFAMDFDGEYTFDARIIVTDTTETNQVDNLRVIFRINEDAAIDFTLADLGINGINGRTQYTYSDTHTLKKGDFVHIFFVCTTGGGTGNFRWYNGEQSFLIVDADTTFKSTSSVLLYPHDVFRSIIGRIVDDEESFYSEYLGGSDSQSVVYDDEGCGSFYGLMLGAHIRAYSIANKPFSASFEDIWEGMNKIFNLGLGYEVVEFDSDAGTLTKEVIRIEPKAYFFDDTSDSLELTGVDGIQIEYDDSVLYKSVKAGYKKWQDESYLGIDDPQTQHNYSSRFKIQGQDLDLFSPFVAASLVMEQGRRKSETPSEDWGFDDETFILHLNDDLDGPRLYSDSLVTNLINADSRYNIRLTPKSNLIRWNNVLSNGIAPYYPSDEYRFNGGQGNTKVIFSDASATGCDLEVGKVVDEDSNMLVTQDYLFQPKLIKFTHKLNYRQYQAITSNKKKSISVSYVDNEGTDTIAKCFIKKLGYKINQDSATFECWVKTLSILSRFDVEIKLDVSGQPGLFDPTWTAQFICEENSDTLEVTGSDIDGPNPFFGGSQIQAIVTKTSNGGIAQSDGLIEWVQDGVTVHSVSFVNGENMSNVGDLSPQNYIFTNVQPGTLVRVAVFENL